ncbi:MAG: DUF4058 family protein [Chloroflexi bacterium]|nr:DUF4058 family protein [Chloroflexota bacterium]
MPSPFPGMDPYIEQSKIWRDFHNDLAAEMRARLNEKIQPKYFARLEGYITYEVVTLEQTSLERKAPEVTIWQNMAREAVAEYTAVTPLLVESEVEFKLPLELLHIEIFKVGNESVVTVIEILSPVNKQPSHKACADYLEKRRDVLDSHAHFVEIDLLRAGTRPPLAKPVPPAPYYIMLSRATRRPFVQVWCIQLADKLPVLPIPLTYPDSDVELDMGAIVASVYERGAYGAQIDYREPVPPPRLAEQEETFVNELLKEHRKGN